ncbi:MAG: GTP-binding protein [Candidatus Heimdallarchaeota archaeon]|nr:GTP-binding protein [Candidatus Heimdallarchaeota archaeon]
MSFILRLFKKVRKATITIAGLDNAGKTAFINYLITGAFQQTTPTTGVNREVINIPQLQINVCDLGGQEKFRVMWPQMNEMSDGLIYVFDSSDYERFDLSLGLFYEILQGQVHEYIPVLILLHKSDLNERMVLTEFLQKIDMSKYNVQWACFETSAVTGQGIFNAMTWFIKELEERH